MAAATVTSKTALGAYIRTVANGDYTATRDDQLLKLDATSGAVNVTLPSAASYPGLEIKFKRIDSVVLNAVTIIGTIDGVVNKTLGALNSSLSVMSDGTAWFATSSI